MNKDPAFLFYSGDFLVGTMLMSNEEVGKYIRLMCLAHQKGGYLTKEDMFKICNTSDIDVINKFKVDDEGIYYNERLLSEIVKRSKYSESRRSNRTKKEVKNDTYDLHMSNISNTYDSHMENENENINDNVLNTSLKKKNNKNKVVKLKFGEYKNVLLTQNEYDKLVDDYSNINLIDLIEWFSAYIEEKDYKSKSHNLAIRRWVVDAFTKSNIRPNNQSKTGSRALDMLNELENENE